MRNWIWIEGNWNQLKGEARERWDKLTDNQLEVIAGKRVVLSGTIQELYGLSTEEAERQLDAFAMRCEGWTFWH